MDCIDSGEASVFAFYTTIKDNISYIKLRTIEIDGLHRLGSKFRSNNLNNEGNNVYNIMCRLPNTKTSQILRRYRVKIVAKHDFS